MLMQWSNNHRRRHTTVFLIVRILVFLILQSGFILWRLSSGSSQSNNTPRDGVDDAPPPLVSTTTTLRIRANDPTSASSSIQPSMITARKMKNPAVATAAAAVRRQQQQQQEYEQLQTTTRHADNDGGDSSLSSLLPPTPVHIYVLAGQSNMVGYGSVEHLRVLLEKQQQQQHQQQQPRVDGNSHNNINNNTKEETFFTGCGYPDHQHLWNQKGDNRSWTVLDHITVVSPGNPHGQPLSVGLGKNASYFGPELGFAWALQLANNNNKAYNVNNDKTTPERIVLIKTAWNEKSLAVDFRPPSAGNNTTYLNYKGDPIPTFRYGEYYRAMRSMVHDTIYNLTQIVGEQQQQGSNRDDDDQGQEKKRKRRASFEIKGFVWFQGWSDQNEDRRLEYASNLAHLIRDVRSDVLNVKKYHDDDIINSGQWRRKRSADMMHMNNNPVIIPVIIGETGQLVKKPRQRRHIEQIRQAQEAVTLQPEFCASTRLVRTRHLVHDHGGNINGKSNDLFAKRYSNTFHFSGHADTIYAIGCAMGEAMLKLQQQQQQQQHQYGNYNGNTTDNNSCAGETAQT